MTCRQEQAASHKITASQLVGVEAKKMNEKSAQVKRKWLFCVGIQFRPIIPGAGRKILSGYNTGTVFLRNNAEQQ